MTGGPCLASSLAMAAPPYLKGLDAETIRAVVTYIRDDSLPAFTSDRFTQDIDPSWLSTPARRLKLWTMLQRLHDLEEESGG